jgi:hypothetical protein
MDRMVSQLLFAAVSHGLIFYTGRDEFRDRNVLDNWNSTKAIRAAFTFERSPLHRISAAAHTGGIGLIVSAHCALTLRLRG